MLLLGSGIGLGDAVQMGILLRHLRKYRSHWTVDCHCQEDHVPLFAPHCNLAFSGKEADKYDATIRLDWGDVFGLYGDRPSTKVAFALRSVFGIEEYDASLGRYDVPPVDKKDRHGLPFAVPPVTFHFAGVSYKSGKDLDWQDAVQIYEHAKAINQGAVTAIDTNWQLGVYGLAGLITKSKAFVGIDSGPGKIASATDTPALICWTGHHPLRYHDPAPNTTHLIHEDWYLMPPFDHPDQELVAAAIAYFRANYTFTTYQPGRLGDKACEWLSNHIKTI